MILVGDTRQLPPTVLSKAAEGARLAQSMFERLERCGWPVVMLTDQYRMVSVCSSPDVCACASLGCWCVVTVVCKLRSDFKHRASL